MNRGKQILLSLFVLTLIWGVLEGYAKWKFRSNIRELAFEEGDQYYYNELGGARRHIPNKVGKERSWDNQGHVDIAINSLGFRGPETSLEKPRGIKRILFVGDSITLGGRLLEKDIYVNKVEKKLSENYPNQFEVLNAGVGDTGLAEELDFFKKVGINTQPDFVVLCWYLNDGRPTVGFPEEKIYKNLFLKWAHQNQVLKNSYFAGYLYDKFRKFLVKREMINDTRFQWADFYNRGSWRQDPEAFRKLIELAKFDWGDGWNSPSLEGMFKMILEMKSLSEKNLARFALVILPGQAQVYTDIQNSFVYYPQSKMRDFCKSNKIPCLDILPPLLQRRQEQIFYDQCHYTPHGNTIVANLISDFLKTTFSLGPSGNGQSGKSNQNAVSQPAAQTNVPS